MARRIAIGVGAVVAVAAVGAGAFAYTELSGGGTQPHDVLPADSVGYLRVDLDPGASQKVDLFRLARRVPDLAAELGVDEDTDLRRLVLDEAAGDCVDDEKDVEPWLGERLGVALGPEASEDAIRIAVQVTDEDAARAGVEKLFACDDEEHGIAFLDGYAIVTPSQATADAAVRAAGRKALGEDDTFTEDMDDLGEQGLVSGWVDLQAVAKVAAEADPEGELGLAEVAEQASSAALAVSIVGAGEQVGQQWDQLVTELDDALGSGLLPFGADSSGVESVVAEVEQTLDVRLPEDLTTLFGDALTLWVGTEGLSELPDASGPDALAADGDLGSSDRFRSVVGDEGDAAGGMFLDVTAIIEALRAADPPPEVAEVLDQVSVVRAVGVTSSRRSDDLLEGSLKVSFGERD